MDLGKAGFGVIKDLVAHVHVRPSPDNHVIEGPGIDIPERSHSQSACGVRVGFSQLGLWLAGLFVIVLR